MYKQDQLEGRELRASSIFKLGKGHGETLTGARTIVNGEGPILAFDAGGSSRNLTLPARADINDGVVMLINNISTAGENLVIKNSAATTLLTLPSQGVALVFASVADETPGTREWRAAIMGGEDLALADSLTVTGATNLNGKVLIGDAVTDSVGFYGTSQTAQPANASQSVAGTTTITAVASTSLTALDLTRINAAISRIEEIRVLNNEIRSAMVVLGLMKGSA